MKFPAPQVRSVRSMRARFDCLELHACAIVNVMVNARGQKVEDIEQQDEAKDPAMFSVYGHDKKIGGVRCLEDFRTYPEALAWLKSEAARCQLDFDDYWEHGEHASSPKKPGLVKTEITSKAFNVTRVATVSIERGGEQRAVFGPKSWESVSLSRGNVVVRLFNDNIHRFDASQAFFLTGLAS